MTDPTPHYLNEDEAAAFLNIPRATLTTWRSRGKGPPYIKAEKTVRYALAALTSWMNSNEVNP